MLRKEKHKYKLMYFPKLVVNPLGFYHKNIYLRQKVKIEKKLLLACEKNLAISLKIKPIAYSVLNQHSINAID